MNWRAKFLQLDAVEVEQRQRRDAEPGEVLDDGRAETARAEDDHARLDQPLLDLLPPALERREGIEEGQVAEVALALVAGQAARGAGVLEPAETVEQRERLIELGPVDVVPVLPEGGAELVGGVEAAGQHEQQRPHVAGRIGELDALARIEAEDQRLPVGDAVDRLEAWPEHAASFRDGLAREMDRSGRRRSDRTSP